MGTEKYREDKFNIVKEVYYYGQDNEFGGCGTDNAFERSAGTH